MSEKTVFKLHSQRGKHDCGIATLATLLGRTYEEVLLKSGTVSPKLLKLGLSATELFRIAELFDATLVRHTGAIDLDESSGILGIVYPDTWGHWVWLTNGLIFCPKDNNIVWDAYSYVKKFKVKVTELIDLKEET